MGTTSRDGGQDAKDATQGSYEVTIARPVGAHLRQGPKPTNQEKGTKPVKLRVRPGHSPETPTIISVQLWQKFAPWCCTRSLDQSSRPTSCGNPPTIGSTSRGPPNPRFDSARRFGQRFSTVATRSSVAAHNRAGSASRFAHGANLAGRRLNQ